MGGRLVDDFGDNIVIIQAKRSALDTDSMARQLRVESPDDRASQKPMRVGVGTELLQRLIVQNVSPGPDEPYILGSAPPYTE